MGNFYTNVTLRTTERQALIEHVSASPTYANMDMAEVPALLLLVVLLGVFFTLFFIVSRRAKRLSNPWLRGFVQIGATVGGALTVILVAGFLWAMYPGTVRGPVVYSPDGKHVAVVTWAVGPLVVNDDIATVKVPRRNSFFATRVFSGPGYSSDPYNLQVRWIDNDHLLIRYDKWFGYDYNHACSPHAFGIEVTCEPSP